MAKQPAKKQKSKSGDSAWQWPPSPMEVFTGLLVLTALGSVCTAYLTFQIMQLQQRAWLAPGKLSEPQNFKTRTHARTEIDLNYENVGREPATKINVCFYTGPLEEAVFQDPQKMNDLIRANMKNGNCDCKFIGTDKNGPTAYPNAQNRIVLSFTKQAVTEINLAGSYPVVFGCLVYETLGNQHKSNVCKILEPITSEKQEWRSTNCRVHNEAD